eukprot:7937485-Pyramimonas_sp.AAC.1
MTRRATVHVACFNAAKNYATLACSPSSGRRAASPSGMRLLFKLDHNKHSGQLALLPQMPTCSSSSEDPRH